MNDPTPHIAPPRPTPPARSAAAAMLGLSFPAREPIELPLLDLDAHYCRRCGATAVDAAITDRGCPFCRGRRLPWRRVHRLGAYRPPLSDWIIRMKFQRQWALADRIAMMLAASAPDPPDHAPEPRPGGTSSRGSTLPPHPDPTAPRVAVVPVPLHWTRRLRRGYDQTRIVARTLAERRGWTLAPLVRRARPTPPQSSITDHAARLRNVRGAFTCRPADLRGWSVWLVDDVVTTGATARQAARLLRRAGASWLGLAVLAVADPLGANFQYQTSSP